MSIEEIKKKLAEGRYHYEPPDVWHVDNFEDADKDIEFLLAAVEGEREACAQVADLSRDEIIRMVGEKVERQCGSDTREMIAAAIRKRGKTTAAP